MTKKLIWLSLTGKIPCIFHKVTGLYCPGCGGTRAVKALLKGQFLSSFLYHPLVIYCVVIAVILTGANLVYWKTRNRKYRLYLKNSHIYFGLGIIVVNFIVKNYFLLVKGIDLMERY